MKTIFKINECFYFECFFANVLEVDQNQPQQIVNCIFYSILKIVSMARKLLDNDFERVKFVIKLVMFKEDQDLWFFFVNSFNHGEVVNICLLGNIWRKLMCDVLQYRPWIKTKFEGIYHPDINFDLYIKSQGFKRNVKTLTVFDLLKSKYYWLSFQNFLITEELKYDIEAK